MQVKKPSKKRQKRCLHCKELFEPNPRTKGKQKYCSKEECQKKRQRQNEANWRRRNPECLELQQEQTRIWYKSHPDYSRNRRLKNPHLAQYNRITTCIRMQKIRKNILFDKSKVILSQLSGNKEYKCYLTKGSKWLYVRLTKASPLSKLYTRSDNLIQRRYRSKYLLKEQLYDLSVVFNQPVSGP
ncbi:MAG: hypothetical protein GY853_01090 [PVC group bacterium]|nr:hypothetical protein [PVC group bacterium]